MMSLVALGVRVLMDVRKFINFMFKNSDYTN